MSNEILKIDNSLVFDFPDITGSTKYHCQVSRYFDFSPVTHESNTLTTSTYSVTLTGGNYKYYWRTRGYNAAWLKWDEVQSFVRIADDAKNDLTVADGKWLMFEETERNSYTLLFTNSPSIVDPAEPDMNIFRTVERNLAGELLSEDYATKAKMSLMWDSISLTEKNQVMRYYSMASDNIYLCYASPNGTGYVRRIWKIFFIERPVFQMLNENNFKMTLELEER